MAGVQVVRDQPGRGRRYDKGVAELFKPKRGMYWTREVLDGWGAGDEGPDRGRRYGERMSKLERLRWARRCSKRPWPILCTPLRNEHGMPISPSTHAQTLTTRNCKGGKRCLVEFKVKGEGTRRIGDTGMRGRSTGACWLAHDVSISVALAPSASLLSIFSNFADEHHLAACQVSQVLKQLCCCSAPLPVLPSGLSHDVSLRSLMAGVPVTRRQTVRRHRYKGKVADAGGLRSLMPGTQVTRDLLGRGGRYEGKVAHDGGLRSLMPGVQVTRHQSDRRCRYKGKVADDGGLRPLMPGVRVTRDQPHRGCR